MVLISVRCLYCQSDQVTKRGKTKTGKQRYRCHNPGYAHQSFLFDPAYKGRLPATKQQMLAMSLHASGGWNTYGCYRSAPEPCCMN
jgi:transposase-like protein